MGTWDVGTFDNDDASEVLASFEQALNIGVLEEAISEVLVHQSDYLEAPEAQRGLAAAAMIAALNHREDVRRYFGDPIANLVERSEMYPGPDQIDKARAAVKRIMQEPSELVELWQESPQFETWKRIVEDLAARI